MSEAQTVQAIPIRKQLRGSLAMRCIRCFTQFKKKRAITLHHVLPRRHVPKGQTNSFRVPVCRLCHRAIHALSLEYIETMSVWNGPWRALYFEQNYKFKIRTHKRARIFKQALKRAWRRSNAVADSDLKIPAWVEMQPGLWWWGDWQIEEIANYGFCLTVSSGVQYGPFRTLNDAKEKAAGVVG